MKRYRVGSSWGVTIVEFDMEKIPDKLGRRPGDRLVGTAQTPEDARRIVEAMNGDPEA